MVNQTVLKMLHSGHADVDWFNSNLSSLRQDFADSFVAVCDKKVVDSDKNLKDLMGRLKAKRIDLNHVFIEFVSNVKSIL